MCTPGGLSNLLRLRHLRSKSWFFAVFGGGNSVPCRPLSSVTPWESRRSTSDSNQRYYGVCPGEPAGRSGAGWRARVQSRGTAWRVILQASPVAIPSERAMNRVWGKT